MPKLSDLDPQFLCVVESNKRYAHVDTLAEAHGIRFECPKCGNHQILVWFHDRDVPSDEEPLPRWTISGKGIDDLTLMPSINVPGCWHGFVQGGSIR